MQRPCQGGGGLRIDPHRSRTRTPRQSSPRLLGTLYTSVGAVFLFSSTLRFESSALSDLPQPPLSDVDRRFLLEAAAYLEHPTLLTRIANLVGKPIESLLGALPE